MTFWVSAGVRLVIDHIQYVQHFMCVLYYYVLCIVHMLRCMPGVYYFEVYHTKLKTGAEGPQRKFAEPP